MREDEFYDLLEDQWDYMELFFLKRIRAAGITWNEEQLTDELINTTFLEVWEIVQANKYLNYNPVPLLITKAKNVWSAFLKDTNHPLRKAVEFEPQTHGGSSGVNPNISFEVRDELKYLEGKIPQATMQIFKYIAEGLSYKQISRKINKSVTSIKQLIFRQREKLRKLYRDKGK
jgi:DNA-directed RNA polymerase specialized sigma24 family protein